MDDQNRPVGERVTALETEFKAHRRELRGKFTLMNRRLSDIAKQQESQSLNGELPLLKDLAKTWADDDFREGLKSIVAERQQALQAKSWFKRRFRLILIGAGSLAGIPALFAGGVAARFGYVLLQNIWH